MYSVLKWLTTKSHLVTVTLICWIKHITAVKTYKIVEYNAVKVETVSNDPDNI